MALFLQVSSSLAPMQVCWRMLHCPAANPRVATGLRERGLLSTAQVQCGKNRGFDGGASAWLYLLLLGYIAICLYIYIGIVLFFYCFIACLQHGSITFFISIFYFCSLLRPLFFMIVVAVSLSFCFLRCKGMAVLSDTKHQAMPYSAKTFPECLPQMLHIWVFQKTFYRIVWCSDSWNHHFLMHVKRLYDDEMTE